MELNIDGKPCDLGSERIAVPGYDAAALADVEAAREGRSLTLTIPATMRNDVLCRIRPRSAIPPNGSTQRCTRRNLRPKVP